MINMVLRVIEIIHTNNIIMENLKKQLLLLKHEYNVIGIKQSFEDEGALPDDILTMRRLTELCDLKLSVKIGGCEAKTDIEFCNKIGADSIVAPMIETTFALQKYVESIQHINNKGNYINIESKSGCEQLDEMLMNPSSKLLTGLVIGRSDLTKSYGLSKNETDSSFIFDIVYNAMKKSKSYGFVNLMGGNISTQSCDFIRDLYKDRLLDYIETRNVIIKLDNNAIDRLSDIIKFALDFESMWMIFKSNIYGQLSDSYRMRSELINRRIDG
jgi:4-hydroxy-2-oxoheptanedioate aldolase